MVWQKNSNLLCAQSLNSQNEKIIRLKWTFLGLYGPCFCLNIFFCSQCCNLHGRTFLSNIFFQKKLTLPSTFFKFKNIVYKHFSIIEKKYNNTFLLEIFVSFRFRKRLLKTTSSISFSNHYDEPETRLFVFLFEKTKTKRQNVVFSSFLKTLPNTIIYIYIYNFINYIQGVLLILTIFKLL